MRTLAIVLLALGWLAPAASEDRTEPIESDLVETTSTALVQVEVSVSGPREVITQLTAADFELRVKQPLFGPMPVPGTAEIIDDFHIDAVCADRNAPSAASADTPAGSEAGPTLPINYLFYFDQPHLTLVGRQRSIDMARDLIERLVSHDSRATIISNGDAVKVISELVGDRGELLSALERLEGDRKQFEVTAENEEERVARLSERLDEGFGLTTLVSTARNYQFEEVYLADRSLRRLQLTLSRFADLDGSRVAFYFADTMRSNAGEHYMSFFGPRALVTTSAQVLSMDNIQAQLSFDKLVNEAVSLGIRFYPIQGRGLHNYYETAPFVFTGGPSMNSVRQRDAERTLHNLATETGGRAFVRGETSARIAQRIREDFECIYVLSFRADQMPLDAPLALVLKPKRDDIRIRSQGRVVAVSEDRRTATRLLSGFLFERGAEGGSGLGVTVVPTGYRDGAFTALLQISVPGTSLAPAQWDIGASLVFREHVRGEVSGRIELTQQGVPLVFESEIELRPGPYEIIAVAHEATSNLILSEHLLVDWPDPDAQPATLVPVTLLQPYTAAFSREGVTRSLGSLARSDFEALDVDQPLALLGLVCRNRSARGAWLLERSMVGSSRVEFPPMQVELGAERCIQVRDLLPAGSLGPGTYRYEARLVLGQSAFEETARQFQTQQGDL